MISATQRLRQDGGKFRLSQLLKACNLRSAGPTCQHSEMVPLSKRTNRARCISHGGGVSTWHNICKTLDLSAATGKATKQIKEENNALEGLIEDNSIQESP